MNLLEERIKILIKGAIKPKVAALGKPERIDLKKNLIKDYGLELLDVLGIIFEIEENLSPKNIPLKSIKKINAKISSISQLVASAGITGFDFIKSLQKIYGEKALKLCFSINPSL
jgi:acyl carrier protein